MDSAPQSEAGGIDLQHKPNLAGRIAVWGRGIVAAISTRSRHTNPSRPISYDLARISAWLTRVKHPVLLCANNVRGHVPRRRRCPCEPCSNPGNRPDDRLAVQRALWWAGRNLNKSLVFPALERNGNRCFPDRSFWPDDTACNALGSNNHVLERMPDRQR
jgi:hypothetical protein